MSKRIVIGCDGHHCGSISDGYLREGFGVDLVAPSWSVIKLHQPGPKSFGGDGIEMHHAGTYHFCPVCLPEIFKEEPEDAESS